MQLKLILALSMIGLFICTSSAQEGPPSEINKSCLVCTDSVDVAFSNETGVMGYLVMGQGDEHITDEQDICDALLIKVDSNGDLEWSKLFNRSTCESFQAVQGTSDGGYIVAGFTVDHSQDAWLIKTDSEGNEEWNRTFTRAGSADAAASVQETSDGGYILAGSTITDGNMDLLLIKTDFEGFETWSRTFGGPKDDCGKSVQETSDGGYVVCGWTESFSSSGNKDVWLIKTDSEGYKVWENTFGISSDDLGSSALETEDGGYIFAGSRGSLGSFGTKLWLVKTDSSGNKLWQRRIGGWNNQSGESLQKADDGGYIVSGWTDSKSGAGRDLWLVKTDLECNWEWDSTFGGSGNDTGSAAAQAEDGGYVVVGGTDSNSSGDSDIWLLKTDFEGNLEWEFFLGGPGDDFGNDVQKTLDGGYIIAGRSVLSYSPGGEDLWLINVILSLKPAEIDLQYAGELNETKMGPGELGKYEEVLDCYNKTIEMDDTFSSAWNNKGAVLVELGRYEEAIDCFVKAIEINSSFKDAWYNKGVALFELDRFEEASGCFNRATEIDPLDAKAWSYGGTALGKMERYDEAIYCYDKALAIDPEYVDAWNNKGVALYQEDDLEGAVECFEEAIKIDPKDGGLWFNKGLVLQSLGRDTDAAKALSRALELGYAGPARSEDTTTE